MQVNRNTGPPRVPITQARHCRAQSLGRPPSPARPPAAVSDSPRSLCTAGRRTTHVHQAARGSSTALTKAGDGAVASPTQQARRRACAMPRMDNAVGASKRATSCSSQRQAPRPRAPRAGLAYVIRPTATPPRAVRGRQSADARQSRCAGATQEVSSADRVRARQTELTQFAGPESRQRSAGRAVPLSPANGKSACGK